MTLSEENSRQITEALYKIADGLGTVAKVLGTIKPEEPKKKVKAKKDPDAPRRNLTSYIYFAQDQREKILEENPNLNAKDVARVMGERWNNLTQEEKAPYIKLADQDKIRFKKEFETYKSKSEGKEPKETPKAAAAAAPAATEAKKPKAEKENKKTNKQPPAVEEPPKKKAKSNDKKKSNKNKSK